MTFRRDGTKLLVKPGNMPEGPLDARSETRFSLAKNFLEFQRDSSGKATGLVVEQGGQKIPASRIR